MRTTMTIDDDLLHEAKKRAADSGTTVSELVGRVLRDAFRTQPGQEPAAPFHMVTFGGANGKVDHTPADFASAMEEEDLAAPHQH